MSGEFADFAAQTFEPLPRDVLRKLPTRAVFLAQAVGAHKALVLAAGLLTQTPEELTEGVRKLHDAEGEGEAVRLLEEAEAWATWFGGLHETMQVLSLRLLVATARVAEGGA